MQFQDPEDEKIFRTASKLADLLRKSGSRILTNTSALSLTWTVYLNVSKALAIFSNQTDDKNKLFDCKLTLDLEYLTTFLSRVPSLRLTSSSSSSRDLITLSTLSQLQSLQCDRCPLTSIQDLVSLRSQLVSLSVSRCSGVSLTSLISSCLGSSPSPGSWSRLTHLTVSHGHLSSLSSCLSLTPHLTHLDCSHNKICDTTGLEELTHLTHMNLSYNSLTYLPLLHHQTPLSHLSLAYNKIEQLLSLSDMIYIQHLDLSANCLMHHDVLAPLSGLSQLESIDLRFNPLSTHPRHREVSSSWFSPSLASSSPVLDTLQLSRSELLQVGSSRLVISPSVSPSHPVSGDCDQETNNVSGLDDLLESASVTASAEGSLVSGLTISTSGQRRKRRGKSKKKIREAVISDETEYTTTETEAEIVRHDDTTADDHDDSSVTETIQDLRGKFGENWLRSGRSEQLHSLLGLDQSDERRESLTIASDQSESLKLSSNPVQGKESSVENNDKNTNVDKPKRRLSDEVPDAIDEADDDNDVRSVTKQSECVDERARVEKKDSRAGDQCFYSVYSDRESSPEKSCKVSVQRSIPGDDSGLMEDLVLVINKEFIREQDNKGVTRVKWFLHSLEQMEMLSGSRRSERMEQVKVMMMFNTVRRESRERVYLMSETGYSTLMTLVGSVLESAAQSSLRQACLQCVRCGSMFTARDDLKCPNCGSDKLLEREAGHDDDDAEDEEGVSLGIPACEMLDLAVMTEDTDAAADDTRHTPAERSYLGHVTRPGDQDRDQLQSRLSVTADIHCHTVSSPHHALPDLCPRPEPSNSTSPPGSSPAPGSSSPPSESRQSSSSPVVKSSSRSDSSSDISVLSNPSEASIEVIRTEEGASKHDEAVRAAEQLLAVPAAVKTMAVSGEESDESRVMMESSSSDSLQTSSIRISSTPPNDSSLVTPVTSPRRDDLHDETLTPYTSTHTSPVKLARDCISVDGDSSLFLSCQEETDSSDNSAHDDTTVADDDNDDVSPPETPDPPLQSSPILWNYTDFTKADHRVQLYCELTLFKEEEDLLLIVKADLYVRSVGGSVFPGVMLVSNKNIYILSISGHETEEPSDWLHSVSSAEVTKVSRMIGMVGGQGVAVDIQAGSPASQPQSFYRLTGYSGPGSSDAGDCFYVVLGDQRRTERVVDTLVEVLQERVRSNPVPVIWTLGQEQESILKKQLQIERIQSFSAAYQVNSNNDAWEKISLALSDDSIFLTGDFFSWQLTHKQEDLACQASFRIDSLQKLSIYQSCLERTSLHFPKTKLKLRFESEEGLQEFVKSLRGPWEAANETKLEEATHFHLVGGGEVVMMNSLLQDDSVLSQELFDLSLWIKVTTVNKQRK